MVLLVLIALLHSREHWKPAFTVSTMLLATIPLGLLGRAPHDPPRARHP